MWQWDCGIDATYLAVGDVTLEDDQIVQEVMHPGEQAELRTWWPEDKQAAAESTKPVVKQVSSSHSTPQK